LKCERLADSGVRTGLFAVLVEMHPDLAKWLSLSDADGCSQTALFHEHVEPALLCSHQPHSTQSYPQVFHPLVPPQAGHGEAGRGTNPRLGGRACWQSSQMLNCQPTIHSSVEVSISYYE